VIKIRRFPFNEAKAYSALIYLLREYPGVKKTQIMKFFFLADFYMFAKYEYPIFGGVYIHMDRGPVPIEVKNKLLPELIDSNLVRIEQKGGYKHFLNIDLEPDISVFTVTELDTMHKTISFLKHLKTSENVSNFTHNFGLWKLTKDGEPIPYEFARMTDEEIKKYLEEHRFYKQLALSLPTPKEVPNDYWNDYEIVIPASLEKEMLKTAFEN